ncbi:MAG: DUF5686 family protein, partial [Bacteroidia bacterium]|nr:DUF5686 and carboxypeptidase regulatory-like domain-containing protein [Bacteroidia bacterium]MDW8014838.1 DUF5686 family protein [Bacteroidia bacterium]
MYWLAIAFIGIVWAQEWIEGSLIEPEGEPIPFATIQNLRTHQGTYADLQGRFRIRAAPTDTIEVRCVGYLPRRLIASEIRGQLVLFPTAVEMEPVVIQPTENPAYALLRRLQAKAAQWDPLQHPHKYVSYNKLSLTLPETSLKTFVSPHLFIWETETEKLYFSPAREKETLRAQRIVGNLPVQSILSPTSFLPLSVYRPRLKILEREFISPVGSDGFTYYEYGIKDTMYAERDTFIRVDFFPKRGKETHAFRGQLTIILPDAALYTFFGKIDKIYGEGGILEFSSYSIWHFYEKIGDTLWFPTQLHSEATLRLRAGRENFPSLILRSRSFLKEVTFPSREEELDRSEVLIRAEVPELKERAEPLTPEELTSYRVLDSLLARQEVRRLRWLFDLPTLVTARLPLGVVNLVLRPLLLYHEAEGLRPQMGVETSDEISEVVRLRIWGGYGLRSQAGAQGTPWRYGGEIEIGRLHRFQAFYYDDVRERTLPRLIDEIPASLPGEQRVYEVVARGYAFGWEELVREKAVGLRLRLAVSGKLFSFIQMMGMSRSAFSEQWQGIVAVSGMEYLAQQTLLRRGGTSWRLSYEGPRLCLQTGFLRATWTYHSLLPLLPWFQFDFWHQWRWGRAAAMRVRVSATLVDSRFPEIWRHRLRTLPRAYLGVSDALAAHPIRQVVLSAVYGFYEWSLPNQRFPTAGWAPILTLHLQGAYADGVLYPEGGLSLRNWMPLFVARMLPSLALTQVGLFFPLSSQLRRERFYLRVG